MKRSASMLALVLILFVLISFPQIGVVECQDSSVFIRTDGSVEGTDKIHRDGDVYTFTGDISNR